MGEQKEDTKKKPVKFNAFGFILSILGVCVLIIWWFAFVGEENELPHRIMWLVPIFLLISICSLIVGFNERKKARRKGNKALTYIGLVISACVGLYGTFVTVVGVLAYIFMNIY